MNNLLLGYINGRLCTCYIWTNHVLMKHVKHLKTYHKVKEKTVFSVNDYFVVISPSHYHFIYLESFLKNTFNS